MGALKAQLEAKSKECNSAKKAVDVARMQAKKATEGTTHAQLAAKAAETAEKVQVEKLKNSLDAEQQKEAAVAKALSKSKGTVAQDQIKMNAEIQKERRLEAEGNGDKQKVAMEKAALKDEKKLAGKAEKAKEALADAKAKSVAQEAKDAIAEGQPGYHQGASQGDC